MVSLFVCVHARSDAVLGVARPARRSLQAVAVDGALHGPRRARHRVDARRLPARSSNGRCAGARACSRSRGGAARELRDGAAHRHRVRAAARTRASSRCASAPPVGSEPRVHRQQGAAGRGGAQGVSRDRARDDHGGNRGGPQLRARSTSSSPTAASAPARSRTSRRPSATRCADPGHRAYRRLQPPDLREPAGPGSGDAHAHRERGHDAGRRGPGHRGPRAIRKARQSRAVGAAQQRRRRPTSASPCSRWGRRCGRCSPATR